ncbi:Hypothetical predicted protein [Lynx pardinus]|uniref:Uncharacterized protein n=1 Tax=Lynx pardinus TaxID=191816 RepID=A0A485NFY4_LYNPA|nr:Hypothetical predicted protein [Lynx pardinus]
MGKKDGPFLLTKEHQRLRGLELCGDASPGSASSTQPPASSPPPARCGDGSGERAPGSPGGPPPAARLSAGATQVEARIRHSVRKLLPLPATHPHSAPRTHARTHTEEAS